MEGAPSKWMNKREAADYLGVSVRTLSRWMSNEKMNFPIRRIGGLVRTNRALLDAWVDSRK